MVCQEFYDFLDNYESLDEAQREELENHASLCSECSKELEFFRSIIETSASISCPQPPKTLIHDINARLDREGAAVGAFARLKYNIKNNTRGLATIAACLAVGAAVGLNSGYIKDRLTDNAGDGVIRETVGETSDADELAELAKTADVTNDTENDGTSKTANIAGGGEKPDSSPVANSAVSKTEAVMSSAQAKANIHPTATSTPTSTHNPSVNAVRADATEAPSARDTLEIREEYYLPKGETASEPASSESEADINSYSIANENSQLAYGYENIPQRNAKSTYMHDYLSIETSDMDAVVSTMNEMGVQSSGDCFMTPRDNFYRLLDRLNSQGVKYTCDLKYNSSDRISFKLMHD